MNYKIGSDVVETKEIYNGLGHKFMFHYLADGWIRIWEWNSTKWVEGTEAKDERSAYEYTAFKEPMYEWPRFNVI